MDGKNGRMETDLFRMGMETIRQVLMLTHVVYVKMMVLSKVLPKSMGSSLSSGVIVNSPIS